MNYKKGTVTWATYQRDSLKLQRSRVIREKTNNVDKIRGLYSEGSSKIFLLRIYQYNKVICCL